MVVVPQKKKTVKFSIIFSVLFSVIIIAIILFLTITPETIHYLLTTPIRYEYFIFAGLFNFLIWGLWGIRIKILSHAIDPSSNISVFEATKIVIANLFLANITPSMAGGEPVRIYLLKQNGLNVGGATAVTISERLLDALVFLMCVPLAFYIFGSYITNEYLQTGLYIAIFLFILFVFIFLYTIRNPKKIKSLIIKITRFFKRIRKKEKPSKILLNKISNEVDNFHGSMMFFLTKGKKTLLLAGFITVLFWLSTWSIPIFLLIGLGIKPTFLLQSYAAQILIVLIAMMPTTPGSTGVSEGGVAALYGVFISSSLLGVFVLLYRFITYHMGLIMGAIFQYKIFKSVASFSTDMIKTESS